MSEEDSTPRTGTTLSAAPGADGSTKLSDSGLHIIVAMGSAGGNLCTIVGRKVRLAAWDAQNQLVSGAWFIPDATKGDDAIKSYDYSAADPADVVKLLDKSDFDSSHIDLFWVRPGKKKVVFTSNSGVTVGQTITVVAPAFTAEAFTTVVAQRTMRKNAGGTLEPAPRLELGDHFHSIPGEWPGIRFRFSVTPTGGGDGQIAGVQLMSNKSVIVTSDGVTHNPRWQEWVLDTQAPYDPPSAVQANKKGDWIRPPDDTGSVDYDNGYGVFHDPSDTPCVPLDRHFKEVRVRQFFRMFLMYRPAEGTKGDSIWVTLAVLEWYWTISTVFESGMWSEPTDVDWPAGTSVQGKPSSELPRWSRVFLRELHYESDYDPPVQKPAAF